MKLTDKNKKNTNNNLKLGQTYPQSMDVVTLVEKKIVFFQDIIQRTILHIQRHKMLDILGISDVTNCLNTLQDISKKIKELTDNNTIHTDILINNLQNINNELSGIFKMYGTDLLEDLLTVCFGNNSLLMSESIDIDKFNLLKKYFHPTSYKVIGYKEKIEKEDDTENDNEINIKIITDENIYEKSKNLDCFDVSNNVKKFHMKVYGIKVFIKNNDLKKSLLITGILDDVIIDFLNNKYINNKLKQVKDNIPNDSEFNEETFKRFVSSLTLKDYLINQCYKDIYSKFIGTVNQNKLIKQKTISQCVKEFSISDLFNKRNMLIQLLIHSNNYDNQYLAYLLYDLLSNDVNGTVDTLEQTILFDSFQWSIKQYFKDAMKKTIQYTNEIINYDNHKIPLEQQICLLKVNDNVKEKAMIKLKEVKSKSEDSGSKARQYLEGLLKIPFGIYKREPIMNIMNEVRNNFKNLCKKEEDLIPHKEKYSSIEILKYVKELKTKYSNIDDLDSNIDTYYLKNMLNHKDKSELVEIVNKINNFVKKNKLKINKLKQSHKIKEILKNDIYDFLENFINDSSNSLFLTELIQLFPKENITSNKKELVTQDINFIEKNIENIFNYISNVKSTLDNAVHGHDKAKRQIERIIAQWINGDKLEGYVFGFEGAPGIGKTSLAKRGLSDCLKDENGNSRPFAMIAIGGDTNSSTLCGHNYTYVGSTWGSIVQILMDKKCMNPIIFIDEIDKVSKTEHGKEIIGVLTHLLDSTQNDSFQDKYFNGIDLDLSKALFILSYNDVSVIDKILLDRIHRIKFNNLSIEEKIVICNNYVLPELCKNTGLDGMIHFDNSVLKYIIEEYTCEAGIRKLKQYLFEIVGEINLDIFKNRSDDIIYNIPINITIDDIKTKYFKEKREVKIKKIHEVSSVGIVTGLWASESGMGGIIPIQVKYYPVEKFLNLKLTGMQGDVMQESMNVALTLAWNLTDDKIKNFIKSAHIENNSYGIHIHCPEGSVSKNGPSAGTAITTAIYSLFNNKKIKNYVGITGEISLDGTVTEIGGLDLKILWSIKSGVKEFIYPKENQKDLDEILLKHKDSDILSGIKFHSVSNIYEVFEIIFE
jgi:ATP-dependent Lon protease